MKTPCRPPAWTWPPARCAPWWPMPWAPRPSCDHGPLARRRALLQQVMRQVELHANDLDMSSTRMAREFSISLRTLHQLFEMSDTTFHEYLTSARLARACQLLRDPASQHLSTMDVGFAAGFARCPPFTGAFASTTASRPANTARADATSAGAQQPAVHLPAASSLTAQVEHDNARHHTNQAHQLDGAHVLTK
jgi:AraC-like DNA-binding protein